MKIFLIGLPGSGKSTLGRQLARQRNSEFIDLDQEIEKQIGLPVPEIFRQYGEMFFRKQESQTLRDLSEKYSHFVMATGGGAPMFFENMKFMNATGTTVFLDVPVEEVASRILKSNRNDRPLLASLAPAELKDKIELLRKERITVYQQASITLSGAAEASDLNNVLANS